MELGVPETVQIYWYNLPYNHPPTSTINQGAALVTGAASVIGTGSVVTPAKEFRSSQFSQCFQHLSSSFSIGNTFCTSWNTSGTHLCCAPTESTCHWKILVAAQDLKIAEDPEALEPQIATDSHNHHNLCQLCWLYAGYHDPIFFNRSQQHTIQNFERKGTWTFFTRHAVRRFSEDLFPSEQTRQMAPGSMIYHDLGGCKKNQEDPQFHNMATTSARELHHIPSPWLLKRSKVFPMTLLCDNGLGMNLRKCRLCTKKDLATFELVLFGRQRCIKILYFHHQLCWDSCTATDLLS